MKIHIIDRILIENIRYSSIDYQLNFELKFKTYCGSIGSKETINLITRDVLKNFKLPPNIICKSCEYLYKYHCGELQND